MVTQLNWLGERRYWYSVRDGNLAACKLYHDHYSYRPYADGRKPKLFCGPGEKIVLLTPQSDALFVWKKFIESGQTGPKGINCGIFRNESEHRSSDMILEAAGIAWQRWPGERLYTYVNGAKVKSSNPGYCYQMAGWTKCGISGGA